MEKDILNSLELAEAHLSDDIQFLHCLEAEYLVFKEPQENITYLYWQMQSLIRTLTKSMEYNQKEMQENIAKHYDSVKKNDTN